MANARGLWGTGPLHVAVFVLLAISSLASTDDKCRTGCHEANKYFKYADGQTYKYNLESKVDITLSSSPESISESKLTATVLLTQQPNCNQVIRLQSVQITGAGDKKHSTVPNIDKPIKINFHDGHVEDVICVEHDDTQSSLNIKRAVASLFQVAMGHNHETDVFGVCPTSIQSTQSGNILTVTKSRILNRCSHREHAKHDFLATAFNLHSEIKSSPILKSDYTAEQRIKNGILDNVLITENYLYVPFSVGKNGAKATVQTKLTFAGKAKDNAAVKCSEPKSIIFEDPHPTISGKSDVSAIVNGVKETANSIGDVVSEDTASKFSNLINILSHAKKDDLLAAYSQIKAGAGFTDKQKGKKVFLDGLFRTGTGESLEVAVDLMKNKELSPIETKFVYLGMAFVRHATPNSLTSAAALLDQPNLPREAYLGVGTLAARFCGQHSCKNVAQINKLSDKLISKLVAKPSGRNDENQNVAILKALTNMKHLNDAAANKIVALAQDKKSSNRIRVAALEAYKADACKDRIRDSAISILKDIQQDSEIRIKAYLALADCPNGKVAAAVKNVLDNEPSYQVGGFIVSHIRNLRASANPDKELAKQELANVNTMKRFPIDPRKFSYNSEVSYSFDTLGMSSSVENNVIYSQSSWIPRSTCLNLTTEVFGHKFNFLEIDARQENLDKVVEHYLGPLGVIRGSKPDELLKNGKSKLHDLFEHFEQRIQKYRAKRQVPKNEIENMGKQMQIKSNDLNNDLDLDLSVKVFGSEMYFLSLNEEAAQVTPEAVLDKILDKFDEGIDKLKKFDHTFVHNGMFLDAELTYPTSAGFGLRLSAVGTSSVQLKTSGSIDLRAFMNLKDTIAKLTAIPSANVEVAGRLTIDTGAFEKGIKTVSSLYTATGSATEFEFFKAGTGYDFKVTLPLAKQHLISAKHDIVLSTREHGGKEVEAPMKFVANTDFEICFDQLENMIGMTACLAYNTPNIQQNQAAVLALPLMGGSKIDVWIDRDEPVTFHYRDVAYLRNDDKQGFTVTIETIGENKQKKVSFDIEMFFNPEKYIKLALKSPIKNAELEGRVIDTANEKALLGKISHDNDEYSGKIGFSVSGGGAKTTYTPIAEYVMPGAGKQAAPYNVEGTITVEKTGDKEKYTFNGVKLNTPHGKQISITGYMGKETNAVFSDLQLSDGSATGSLKGKIKGDKDGVKIEAEVKNSMSPISNFALDYELKRSDHSLSSDLSFTHGDNLKSKENTLKLYNSVDRKYNSPSDFKFATKHVFSYPVIATSAKIEVESTPKSVDFEADIKYNKFKLGTDMDLKYNQKTRGDYDFKLEAHAGDSKLKAIAKRVVQGDKSKIDNSIEYNGRKADLKGEITHKLNPNDIELGAKLTHSCPMVKDLSIDFQLIRVPQKINTHLKASTPSHTYIDYALKAGKTEGANGHLKLNIQDAITVDGEIKADKWVGKASMVVDFIKAQKKLKMESTFKVAAPTYNMDLVFYPNFEKDDKKIKVTTTNDISENKIDSKNIVDAFGKKFEYNMNINKEGEPAHNGKINGDAELILPDEKYFSGKFIREMHVKDNVANGNFFVSFEQRVNKNTPGRKVSLKGVANNVNPQDRTFDIKYNFAFDNSNGKNVNADVSVKRTQNGDKKATELQGKLYGSAIPDTLELDVTASNNYETVSYDVKAKAGDKAQVHINGNGVRGGEGKPFKGDISVEAKTAGKIKTFKFTHAGSLLKNDGFEFSGKSKLFIDHDIKDVQSPIDYSSEADVKILKNSGQIKLSSECPKFGPLSLAISYGHSEENDIQKCQADVNLQYAKGKTVKGDITVITKNKNEVSVDLKLDTPEGKTYKSHAKVFANEMSPSVDIQFVHPDGKTDKFAGKLGNLGGKNFNSEVSVVYTPNDFTFDGSLQGNIDSIEEFHITAKVDSPKLDMKKIVVEAQNKKQKSISLKATSEGKNLFDGSTSYKTREESGKYIIEGSGDIKVKDQKKSLTFKLIKQNLSTEKNGENGFEVRFDAKLGSKAIDAEFKATNKQIKILNSYCEEKQQCAHVEIDAKTNKLDVAEYNNVLEVTVDLRKLGIPNEFGVKAVTNRKGFVLDHTFDLHFQSQENNKYQYNFYIHPKNAGIVLTTPKRQVALEGNLNIAPKFEGPTKADVSFWLNKKANPDKKSSLTAMIERTGNEKKGSVSGEIKFTAPAMARDMKFTYKSNYDLDARKVNSEAVLDVFAQENQKIIFKHDNAFKKTDTGLYEMMTHDSVKSVGLEMDISREELRFKYNKQDHTFKHYNKLNYKLGNRKFENLWMIETSPKMIHAQVKLFDKEILDVQSNLQLSENSQVADTNVKIYGGRPTESHFELKNWNTLKYTLAFKDKPDTKLIVNAGFIPGQVADFRAAVGGADLVHASVKLDDANFLKPDYGVNSENLKTKLVTPYQTQVNDIIKEGKTLAHTLIDEATANSKHMGEVAKKSMPNFKPTLDYYSAENQKIRDEINTDKNMQEIGATAKNIFGAILKYTNAIAQKVHELFEGLTQTVQTNIKVFTESFEKDIAPKLKQYADLFAKEFTAAFNQFSEIVFQILGRVSEFLEAHQAELKQIATSFSGISQEAGRFVMKNYEQVRAMISENVKRAIEEIKALPVYEETKERLDNLMKDVSGMTAPIAGMIKDALGTLRDIAPNEELKKLINLISDYLDKKMNQEKVDDVEALSEIARVALNNVKIAVRGISMKEGQGFDPTMLTGNYLYALPRLVAAKFSPLTYLSGDLPVHVLRDSLYSVSLNPKSWIPPFRLYAFTVQGQHIFTFDGKHMTFPGQCNYILARDSVNGNFTIAATYKDGIMTALTVADKTDSITVKKGGQCAYNKDTADFPIHKPNIEAHRHYNHITISLKAGAKVYCDPQLVTCTYSISGFYHGQIKGLLGNGNNEPFDDFTLPNGKIVTSESDFGNAYKTQASCAKVATVDHSGHSHAPSCTKLFGPDSNMRLCFPFVNPENFRTACDHGVAAGVKDTEQSVAAGYVSACLSRHIPVFLPTEYQKCTNGDTPKAFGEKFSVKTPSKAADILVVVDLAKGNEVVYKELVTPLINEMTKELSSKGLTDIEIGVLGYGGENSEYGSHFTNGGKIAWKGKMPTIQFSDPKPWQEINSGNEKLDKFLYALRNATHELSLVVGADPQGIAYTKSLLHPYRSHAAKTIIAVTAEPCHQGFLLALQKLRAVFFVQKLVHVNLITPVRDFSAKDAKTAKSIIGFTDDTVFTYADGKKKPAGGAELIKDIHYNDYCVDFITGNKGIIFNTDNFLASKKDRKTFVSSAAHNLAEQLANTKQGLDCECTFRTPFDAANRCMVVHSH